MVFSAFPSDCQIRSLVVNHAFKIKFLVLRITSFFNPTKITSKMGLLSAGHSEVEKTCNYATSDLSVWYGIFSMYSFFAFYHLFVLLMKQQSTSLSVRRTRPTKGYQVGNLTGDGGIRTLLSCWPFNHCRVFKWSCVYWFRLPRFWQICIPYYTTSIHAV